MQEIARDKARDPLLTVLIIEDDEVTAQTYERALRFEGFAVATAHDAETGLRESKNQPDMILIDLQLPLVEAIDVIRQVRAREHLRHTPIAIITGDYRAPKQTESALKELDAHLFYKPLWIEHIVTIARGLARRSL
jgi:two-component system response regulator MprA